MLEQCRAVGLDEFDRPTGIARGQGVVDRLNEPVVVGKPFRRGAVQRCCQLRVVTIEASPQELSEQVLIPEPIAVFIESAQEQVTCLDLLEHGLPARLAAERGRQRSTDPLGDRGRQQESQHLGFQCAQDVLGEEIRDGMVPAGDVADQLGRSVGPPQRERRQLQGSDPAIRRVAQIDHIIVLQVQPGNVNQKRPRLRLVETQCADIDFDELIADPHAAEWQARPRSAGDHDLQVVTAVLEQEIHRTYYGGSGNPMPIVDDDRHRLVTLGDLIDQRRQNILFGVFPTLFEYITEIAGNVWICSPDRFHQVGEKPHDVVVVVIDSQPRHRHPIARQLLPPLRGERRLSVSGRRVNHRQPPPFSRA